MGKRKGLKGSDAAQMIDEKIEFVEIGKWERKGWKRIGEKQTGHGKEKVGVMGVYQVGKDVRLPCGKGRQNVESKGHEQQEFAGKEGMVEDIRERQTGQKKE